MMGNSSESRSKFPFTARQWQELEQQAMIYSYMVAGIPIPPHLLYSSSKAIFPNHQTGSGRCRRTDGKRWRCSREACPDSRYCERHLHRGLKNRSTNLTSSSSSNHFSLYSTTPQFLFDSSSTRDSFSGMNQEPPRKTTDDDSSFL